MRTKEKRLGKSFINGCLASYRHPFSTTAEQYREIRNHIGFAAGGRYRSIAVTSPSEGDGKSTAAVNLAVSLTQRGDRVLLVDANLRKPVLHQLFEASLSPGMSDVLVGQSSLADAVQATGIERLALLSGGSLLHAASDMIDSRAAEELLNEAGESFDVVVLDCPAVLESPDACALAGKCDGAVLVITGGRTHKNKALQSKRLLEFGKANVLGVILNRNRKIYF